MSVLFWLQVCTPFAFIYTFCFHIQLARKEICFHIHFAERKELFNPTAVCLQQTACSFDKSIFETFFETFIPPLDFTQLLKSVVISPLNVNFSLILEK